MVKETRGRKEETNKVTETGSKGGERRVTFREIKVRGEG